MPLRPVPIPEWLRLDFRRLFDALKSVKSDEDAEDLALTTRNFVSKLDSELAQLRATVLYEAARAILGCQDLRAEVYCSGLEFLREALEVRKLEGATLEHGLLLMAFSSAPDGIVPRDEVIGYLRSAVDILEDLPERSDYGSAMLMLAELLAESVSERDLRESLKEAERARDVFVQAGQSLRSIRAMQVMGQAALQLADFGMPGALQIAFECQRECVTLLSASPIDSHAARIALGSSLSDLAEVCLVGIYQLPDSESWERLVSSLSGLAVDGNQAPANDMHLSLQAAGRVFGFLDSHREVAALVLAHSPDLRALLDVMIGDLQASVAEALRARGDAMRSPAYTLGVAARVLIVQHKAE